VIGCRSALRDIEIDERDPETAENCVVSEAVQICRRRGLFPSGVATAALPLSRSMALAVAIQSLLQTYSRLILVAVVCPLTVAVLSAVAAAAVI